MRNSRTIALSLALAVTAFAPAVAVAKHGADDPPDTADDHGGLRAPGVSDDGAAGDRSAATAKAARRSARGTCTGRSIAKLEVKPDDGRLETELEVDQNRNGIGWRVTIRRNGAVAARTTARTTAPSGSFSVERRLRNRPGTDRITARATSPSGEVCTASVSI